MVISPAERSARIKARPPIAEQNQLAVAEVDQNAFIALPNRIEGFRAESEQQLSHSRGQITW